MPADPGDAQDHARKPVDRGRLTSVLRRYCFDPVTAPVLVVEDDQPTRELLRRTLERDGWNVREAENGRVGLEQVAQERPAAIVLDLMMPEVDGFGFIAELRAREGHSIPVVVLTAKELTDEDRLRLNGSVEKVLQKSMASRDQLLDDLRLLLRSHLQPDA